MSNNILGVPTGLIAVGGRFEANSLLRPAMEKNKEEF
jgi:hypothetical protein